MDEPDLRAQLLQWMGEIADVRIHGTTHERPIDRFTQEQARLLPTRQHPSFRLEAVQPRIVADDYLVSLDANRYSVPFTLIGQTVEVRRRAGRIVILHRGAVVADHPELLGKHQLRILPEHGPGAIARTARQRPSTPGVDSAGAARSGWPEVEIRELTIYDALTEATPGDTEIAPPLDTRSPGGAERSPAQVAPAESGLRAAVAP